MVFWLLSLFVVVHCKVILVSLLLEMFMIVRLVMSVGDSFWVHLDDMLDMSDSLLSLSVVLIVA